MNRSTESVANGGLIPNCVKIVIIYCENSYIVNYFSQCKLPKLARIFHEFEVPIGKAFRSDAVQVLPQVPYNAANGHLGRARRVKIFMHSQESAQVIKCHLKIKLRTILMPPEYFYKTHCVEKIS